MKKRRINIFPLLIITLMVVIIYLYMNKGDDKQEKLSYDQFIQVEDNIESINASIDNTSSTEHINIKGKYETPTETGAESFTVFVPYTDEVFAHLDKLSLSGTKVVFDEETKWLDAILGFLPLILFGGLILFFFMRQQGGSGVLDVGKSKARLDVSSKPLTFNDVAGLEEEKTELIEVVHFLKDPSKFTRMGARTPKGVLLVGPPGTGKTLLAKSVAGEAKVPFFFISGSDFLEMFVGVGASRVRDMFKKAKAAAPCLIFIDEIDAIGRQRGAGLGGGNDEREQTLNQILVEMDGFEQNEGIIILAATNRSDVLDPALSRPGRFDRQVLVNLPTLNERTTILQLHAKNKFFEDEVDFKLVAERTPGFSGADLENVLNEATLLAIRENKDKISMSIIDEAIDRSMMGPAKVTKKYSAHEKKMVAFHEAGHVVCGLLLNNANEVHKVTIIPRGMAGGYALMMPKEERFFRTKTELLESITGLLAGRVSEELTFNEISTGAHNDFEQATKIARAMVTEYGMSDLGPIQWEQQTGNVFLGRDYTSNKNFSDTIAHEIDVEVRKIINEAYENTKEILKNNEKLLSNIADALLEKEVLNKEEIIKIYNDYKDNNVEGSENELSS